MIWRDSNKIKRQIIEKFGEKALSNHELDDEYNLLNDLVISNIFKILQKKVGITLRSETLERFIIHENNVLNPQSSQNDDFELNSSLLDFEFVIDDFDSISSSAKGLKFHTLATGKQIF